MEKTVDFVVYEGTMARMERVIRRLFILCLVLILALIGSWIGFFVYESQFEEVSVTQDVDTGEGDAIVAGAGDVYYGESSANS